MTLFPTLYKINSSGTIQEWEIGTVDNKITVIHGLQDGKKQMSVTVVNDLRRGTDLAEQAELDAASKWNLKAKTYYETVEEAMAAKQSNSMALGGYNPMLAKSFWDYERALENASVFLEPKLDGFCGIARKVDGDVKIFARSGEELASYLEDGTRIARFPHIERELQANMNDGEIFHGELYWHGKRFNEYSGAMRADKNIQSTSGIKFWVYDAPRVGGLNEKDSFEDRMKTLSGIAGDDFLCYDEWTFEPIKFSNNVVIAPTSVANSKAEILSYLDDAIENGFEGAMVKIPSMKYESGKRSSNLLKVKKFYDSEYEIIGYKEGKGKLAGHVGAFKCFVPDFANHHPMPSAIPTGKTFDVKMQGETSYLKTLFEHPEMFMHKMLTVKYFELSEDGIPRFPVGIRIREE